MLLAVHIVTPFARLCRAAGVLLALLPPWAVAFDANKATAELNASLNGMYAQRAASLEAMRATFAAGGNSTAALFAALMGTGSNATAAAAAAGASTAAGGAAALPSALTAALPPWSLIGLVSAVAGLITSVLLPAAMRYARLAHFALNPPSWARKYMFTLPGATRLLLGVAFALPGVVAFLWASPLATVTGLPPAAVVWLRPALLLFLAALLGILHTPLLQVRNVCGVPAYGTVLLLLLLLFLTAAAGHTARTSAAGAQRSVDSFIFTVFFVVYKACILKRNCFISGFQRTSISHLRPCAVCRRTCMQRMSIPHTHPPSVCRRT